MLKRKGSVSKEGNYGEEKGGEMFTGSLVMLIIVKCEPEVKEEK